MINTNYERYKKLQLAAVIMVEATTLVATMAVVAIIAVAATMAKVATMVACSTLHKQLYWEFGVSHNCVCIICEGPLMYIVTCLETFCSQQIFLIS